MRPLTAVLIASVALTLTGCQSKEQKYSDLNAEYQTVNAQYQKDCSVSLSDQDAQAVTGGAFGSTPSPQQQAGINQRQHEAEAERIRLEHLGMEQAAARAIAHRQAEELRKHEQPLPTSGVHSAYQAGYARRNMNLPPFKVLTNPGSNYFLKLADWETGRPVLTIFIRGGEEVEVGVPPGTYRIKLASGTTWYGEDMRFGPDTEYSVVEEPSQFTIEGTQLLGHELRLVNVRNGNLRRRPITASQF